MVGAAFAAGLVGGAAGTIVAHDSTTPNGDMAALMADHMTGDMGAMMSGSMMSGPIMGPDASFGPGMMTDPDASSMPGSQHDLHHPAASQDGSK
jgi:hypothetical protein